MDEIKLDTDILSFLEVGKCYRLFFCKGNPNNISFEVKAIIDNEQLVYQSLKTGNYYMKDIYYFDIVRKNKYLTKIYRKKKI